MKVTLVFPPQWIPDHPYLSLPSLAAYLHDQRGDDVQTIDLNVRTFRDLLATEHVEACYRKALDRFRRLQRVSMPSPEEEQSLRMHLVFLQNGERVLAQLERAKDALRSRETFYDFTRHKKALDVIRLALGIVSLASFPTGLGFTAFKMRYSEQSTRQILLAVDDDAENPYRALFTRTIVPEIIASGADFVGISLVGSSQFIPGLTLARLLREACGHGSNGLRARPHVCIGGPLPTMLAEQIQSALPLWDLFDSVVLYEGERPLARLLDALETSGDLSQVPNLLYRKGEEVLSTPLCAPVPMESLPTPDFRSLPLEDYFSPQPVLPLLASRGCYWRRCSFCQHSFGYQNTYRVRPATLVVDDLVRLQERHGTNRFFFTDEAMSPSIARALSEEILARALEICWGTDVRAEKAFTPALCRQMSRAGCREIFVGLESGSDRVLASMDKGICRNQALSLFRNMTAADVWTHAFIVLGFPGETAEEAEDTARFVLENAAEIRSVAFLDSFVLARHCTVQRQPERFGIEIGHLSDDLDLSLYFDFNEPRGRTQAAKQAFAMRFWDRLRSAHPEFQIWYHLFRGDFFHYLCEWGPRGISTLPELAGRARPEGATNKFEQHPLFRPRCDRDGGSLCRGAVSNRPVTTALFG